MGRASVTVRRLGRGTSARDTTAAILDSARGAFNDFGLKRTTMEDIARRAGVARMTVYRHFPTKDDLISALMLREADVFFTALRRRLETCDSLEDGVTEGFAFAVDHLRNHDLLNRLLSTEPESVLFYLTLGARPVLEAGRCFVSTELDPRGAEAEADAEVIAEVLVRLALSFVLTPESVVADVRLFARRYLGSLLAEQPKGKVNLHG